MLTDKQIRVKIGGINRSSKAIRNNIQEVLCNIAGRGFDEKIGDVSLFTNLVNATTGMNQTRIKRWIRDNGLATWNKDKQRYTLNKNAQKEANEKFADAHEYCLYLFTDATKVWYIDPPKDDDKDEKKEFDVTVWAARQFKAQPDHLDAMIKELSKYKEKAKLDLVA
tara:strand:+ start:799 stop:1299 length:501 start_codon:yes stop_codon:yes gene_type:complete